MHPYIIARLNTRLFTGLDPTKKDYHFLYNRFGGLLLQASCKPM